MPPLRVCSGGNVLVRILIKKDGDFVTVVLYTLKSAPRQPTQRLFSSSFFSNGNIDNRRYARVCSKDDHVVSLFSTCTAASTTVPFDVFSPEPKMALVALSRSRNSRGTYPA